MTPTHAISADEARRLLAEDRVRQFWDSALRAARSWFEAHPDSAGPAGIVVTPFGTFLVSELKP